jgi:hypothetical protein
MRDSSDHGEPIVEESSGSNLAERSLHLRIRQQAILAELGVFALQGAQFAELLDHTARLTAEGLEAEYCKVMEYIRTENRLLVRAGVGWDAGVVSSASVGADLVYRHQGSEGCLGSNPGSSKRCSAPLHEPRRLAIGKRPRFPDAD